MDGITTRHGSTESHSSGQVESSMDAVASSSGDAIDARTIKARLFGEEEADRVHKQLLKAKLLCRLQHPTGGADTQEEGATEPIGPALAESPVRIGRYAVLRKLGQGGMGVVYVAYDEDLDRKIALKLLRGDLAKDERGRTRMLREAQALARLSHPNVVQVHEVGQWNDHDYVAMEYVDGKTLDRWLAAERRPWREILDVMTQAGRGLEAAHAAGLVHRDFKPGNLLVGRDGRARVVDFGLARADNEHDPSSPVPAIESMVETAEHSLLDSRTSHDLTGPTAANSAFDKLLTITGAVLGTPAYMAPEQHLGQPANALSDQFSFCVVLYEALFGQRPFKGGSRTEYAINVAEGQLEAPPSNSGVPGWLRKIIGRGLAPRAADRWPSMTVLLAELGRDRTRTWRSAAVAAGLLASFGVALALGGGAEAKICEVDPSSVADTWGDAQRERVRGAFAKVEMSEAEAVLAQATRSLDLYASELVEARAEACKARWVTRSQTDAQLELRNACLEQRERELAAVVEVLGDADREVVLHAPELIAGLGDVGLCGRVELLEMGTPAPRDAEAVAKIGEVRRMIAEAHAARDVGRMAEAKALMAAAWRTARDVEFAPLEAELHFLEAEGARAQLDLDGAHRHLVNAAVVAQQNHSLELAVEVWTSLALHQASRGVDPDSSLEFKLAAAFVQQLGSIARHEGLLAHARGLALIEAGNTSRAIPILDRAIESIDAGTLGSEQLLSRLLALRSRGLALLGRMKEARADLDRAVSARGIRGREHLDALFDLAVLEVEAGEFDDAQRDFADAIAGYEALFDASFETIGHGKLALGKLALIRGDLDAAETAFEMAVTILDQQHPDHDWALDGLASAHLMRGDIIAAEQSLRRAIAHRERSSANDHVRLGYLHTRLAMALLDAQQLDEAVAEFDLALLKLGQPGVDAPIELGRALLGRGHARLLQGHPRLAVESLERGVELLPVDCGDVWLAGEARVVLADALNRLGIRQDEQRDLVQTGIDLLRDFPPSDKLVRLASELSVPLSTP